MSLELLDDLSEEQEEAVVSDAKPLIIVAGAGSGKTRVLTKRIAYRVLNGFDDPSKVLALTFTRKASLEIRSRLAAIFPSKRFNSGTFHSVALAQLEEYAYEHSLRPPRLLTSKIKVLSKIVEENFKHLNSEFSRNTGSLRDVASEIEFAKARNISPEHFANQAKLLRRSLPIPADELAIIFDIYETQMKKTGYLDFDDLLKTLAELIENNELIKQQSRFKLRHFYVDEFQDLNPLQFRLLSAWLDGRDDLTAVGDPNQAIYAWNGADPVLFTHLINSVKNSSLIRLSTNFRSTKDLIEKANRVVNSEIKPSQSFVTDDFNTNDVSIINYLDEDEEKVGLRELVSKLSKDGVPFSEIGILSRVNVMLEEIGEYFILNKIPISKSFDILKTKEVNAILNTVRLKNDTYPLSVWLKDFDEIYEELFDKSFNNDASSPVGILKQTVEEFLGINNSAPVISYLRWLRSQPDLKRFSQGVNLLTFHRSKGLEFSHVILLGLEEGSVPLKKGNDDEERRLFYVACSRAKRRLYLTYSSHRTFNHKTLTRSPSRFLDLFDYGDNKQQIKSANLNVDFLRSKLQAVSSRAREEVEINPQELKIATSLDHWRLNQAKLLNLDTRQVLSDLDIARLSKIKPKTPKQANLILDRKLSENAINEIISITAN